MIRSDIPIVLASDHKIFRTRIEGFLRENGITSRRVGSSWLVHEMTPEEHARALIILDTNDDVARLVQHVNDIHYSPYHPGGSVFAICLVSPKAFRYGGGLSAWLIQGHAAVFSVSTREESFFGDLKNILHRMSRDQEPELVVARPSYDDLVTDVLRQPENPEALMALADRLSEWQDDHWMNRELRCALLRHAVTLSPESGEAHRRYGDALNVHQEKAEAERELRTALRLSPNSAEAHYSLGSFLCFENPEEALWELEMAIAMDAEGTVAQRAKNTIKTTQLKKRLKESL